MGGYTLLGDPSVERAVQRELEQAGGILLDELRTVGCRPQLIAVAGSFGGGEGSAWLVGDNVEIGGEYELGVTCRSPLAPLALARARRRLAESLANPVSLFLMSAADPANGHLERPAGDYAASATCAPELPRSPRVLHGSPRPQRHGSVTAPSTRHEGVLRLCNRMLRVVEAGLRPRRLHLEHALADLAFACGDALLIVRDLYHVSELERAQRFAELPLEVVRAGVGERFGTVYAQAVSRKLCPGSDGSAEPDMVSQLPDLVSYAWNALLWLGCRASGTGEPEVLVPEGRHSAWVPAATLIRQDVAAALRLRWAGRSVALGAFPVEARWLSLRQLLYRAVPSLFAAMPDPAARDGTALEQAWYWAGWTANRTDVRHWSPAGGATDLAESWRVLASAVTQAWRAMQ